MKNFFLFIGCVLLNMGFYILLGGVFGQSAVSISQPEVSLLAFMMFVILWLGILMMRTKDNDELPGFPMIRTTITFILTIAGSFLFASMLIAWNHLNAEPPTGFNPGETTGITKYFNMWVYLIGETGVALGTLWRAWVGKLLTGGAATWTAFFSIAIVTWGYILMVLHMLRRVRQKELIHTRADKPHILV